MSPPPPSFSTGATVTGSSSLPPLCPHTTHPTTKSPTSDSCLLPYTSLSFPSPVINVGPIMAPATSSDDLFQTFLNNTTYSTNLPSPATDAGTITHPTLTNRPPRLSDRFAQLFRSNSTVTHTQFQNYIHVKLDKSAQHLHPDRTMDFILKGGEKVAAITLHAPIDPGSELSKNRFVTSGVHYLHSFFQSKDEVDRVLSKLPPVD